MTLKQKLFITKESSDVFWSVFDIYLLLSQNELTIVFGRRRSLSTDVQDLRVSRVEQAHEDGLAVFQVVKNISIMFGLLGLGSILVAHFLSLSLCSPKVVHKSLKEIILTSTLQGIKYTTNADEYCKISSNQKHTKRRLLSFFNTIKTVFKGA